MVLWRSSYTTYTGDVGSKARAAEIKAVWELETVNCCILLSELKSRYESYYSAQFACFFACFSDVVFTV